MHPSEKRLIDHFHGEDAPPDRDETRVHLESGCEECSRRLEILRSLMTALREGTLPDPPDAWVERAESMRARESVVRRVAEWLGGVVVETARLVVDSGASSTPAFAGTRSGAAVRRLRFEAEDTELDLQIEPRGRGGMLTGQVIRLGEGVEPLPDTPILAIAGEHWVDGRTDDLGEFQVALESVDGVEVHVRTGNRGIRFRVESEDSSLES